MEKLSNLKLKTKLKRSLNQAWSLISFSLLLSLSLLNKFIFTLRMAGRTPQRWKPGLAKFSLRLEKIMGILGGERDSIKKVDLIELSLAHLATQKTRTLVTILGMSIGVGIIVFLLSVGFGVQHLVISRVARLEEMKQADVSLGKTTTLKIDDKTLSDFANISGVEKVLPVISAVGRVDYAGSILDVVVYGVTSDYLRLSAIKPTRGKIFESNETAKLTSRVVLDNPSKVLGIEAKEFKENEIEFRISEGVWIKVRERPSLNAKILGYTRRLEGVQTGVETEGGQYLLKEGGHSLYWIKAKVPLWKEGKEILDEEGFQVWTEGYFGENDVQIFKKDLGVVLGEKAETTEGGESIEWVELATESAQVPKPKQVSLSNEAKRQAVVNRSMLALLGIKEDEAVGKKFKASFIIVGNLIPEAEAGAESLPVEYEIIGVIPGEKTPLFYVPFIDLRSLGIVNFSQAKIVVSKQELLAKVRKQIEAAGFQTASVTDTVAQIGRLFGTLKLLLGLVGLVALSVAALGMFNTLTVSLFERTREVGLMKAMGMKSFEVKELFLAESQILSFLGGVLGIVFGFVAGKILSLVLSVLAIARGVGFVDVVHLPLWFILLILFLSLGVGFLTGIYPARRATKISPLDALRYE